MEELEHLLSGTGIYGKIIYSIGYFCIYVEECEDYCKEDVHYGHVFFVYQLHEGQDLRTHMVYSIEEANECAEKIKKDILAASRSTQELSESLYNLWTEQDQQLPLVFDNVIGKKGKLFGGGFPVQMEKCDDGSYVVFELSVTTSIAIRPRWYKTKKEANAEAQALAKHKVYVYEAELMWGYLRQARNLGFIVKEYPNDFYLTQSDEKFFAYKSDVYRKNNFFVPKTIELFDDRKSAEKFIESELSKENS